jgi:hypothetical protein
MKQQSEYSKFKQFLLRSGIPLEASIAQKVQKQGFIDQGEYPYERNGKIFSIDINVEKTLALTSLHRSYLTTSPC